MEAGSFRRVRERLEVEVSPHRAERTPLLGNQHQYGGRIRGTFFRLCAGDGERARRAIALCNLFKDRERADKIAQLRKLPSLYDFDFQIYQMAKKLGQSEKQIKEQYTFDEIVERNLFDIYDNYIDRELMPKAK